MSSPSQAANGPTVDEDQERLGNQAAIAKLRDGMGAPGDVPNRPGMEDAFGEDFSHLDAYTGLGGGLRDLGSNAAALGGETLLFADAVPSRDLVAHELTHVMQAGGPGARATTATTTAGDSAEQEAQGASAAIARGEAVDVAQTTPGAVAGDTGGAIVGGLLGGLLGGIPGAIVGSMVGDELTDPTPEEEMAEFRAQTFAPMLDHTPSSGGIFDVYFDAAAGVLRVNLKVGYNFVAGDPSQSAPGFPPEEFQWTPAEESEWRTRYQSEISAQWSEQHQFRSTKPGWDMNIRCVVQVTQDDGDPHYTLTVAKYPDDASMEGSSVCGPGTHHGPGNVCPANTDPTDESGTGELDSNDLREEQKLDWANSVHAIPFDKGSTDLNAAGSATVSAISAALTTVPDARVQLTGRASSDAPASMDEARGAQYNMQMARARTDTVKTELQGDGVSSSDILVRNAGAQGATEAEEWCRVDAQGGTQQMQNPALHETGHMFGLGDEYATAANPAGTAVRSSYDAILRNEMGLTITRGRTESAMGSGSTVRNWHYVTFLQALRRITHVEEWTV